MLKKAVFLLILSVVLNGCATTAKYEAKLKSWVGSDENALISAWGPPAQTYTRTDGGKMLTWMSSNGAQAYYNQFTKTVTAIDYWCKTTMTIGSSGTVTSWQYDGNACKSRD